MPTRYATTTVACFFLFSTFFISTKFTTPGREKAVPQRCRFQSNPKWRLRVAALDCLSFMLLFMSFYLLYFSFCIFTYSALSLPIMLLSLSLYPLCLFLYLSTYYASLSEFIYLASLSPSPSLSSLSLSLSTFLPTSVWAFRLRVSLYLSPICLLPKLPFLLWTCCCGLYEACTYF